MHARNLSFVPGISLLTAVTLAGSIAALFGLLALLDRGPVNPHGLRDVVAILLLVIALLFSLGAVGGGLWGLGLAAFVGADGRSAALWGALSWGGTLVIAGLALYFSQIPLAAIDRELRVSDHILFTAAFVPVVGFAAALNSYALTKKLEPGGAAVAARYGGVAATLGFLLMSLILFFGFGWEVGRPRPTRNINMITIMHACNAAACLAGGAALGWVLSRRAGRPVQAEQLALPASSKEVII